MPMTLPNDPAGVRSRSGCVESAVLVIASRVIIGCGRAQHRRSDGLAEGEDRAGDGGHHNHHQRSWLSTGGHNEAAQALYESLGGDRKPLGDVNYWRTLD